MIHIYLGNKCAKASYTLLILTYLFLSTSVAFADDPATFQTIYDPATPTNWLLIGLGAVAMGAVVFFTAGLASPFVAYGVSSIGTAIGGMMGLSGAAATSAGLAFLGGGSLATGGFGMAGGAALLTTVLSFGTEVIVDKSIDYMSTDPVDLSTASRGRVDLRFPVYKKGSSDLRKVSEYLEANIAKEEILDGAHNREVLSQAFKMCQSAEFKGIKEELQVQSTAAIIALILDNYEQAYAKANQTLLAAVSKGEIAPIAEYVLAVSSLNLPSIHREVDHFAHVRSALSTEHKHSKEKFIQGVTPLLISVYADRLQLKVMRAEIRPKEFNRITSLVSSLELKNQSKFMSVYPLATRQLIMLKWFQNKVDNITQTQNLSLRKSPRSLQVAEQALSDFKSLITGLEQSLMLLELSADKENESKVNEIKLAYNGYSSDIQRLSEMIDHFKTQMQSIPDTKQIKESSSSSCQSAHPRIPSSFVIMFMLLTVIVHRVRVRSLNRA